MNKVTTAKRNSMIKHAKALIKLREGAKWEICEIATRLCYLQGTRGGRVPKGAYTITKFAEDIGMNRKTLYCWVLDYQVVYKKINIKKEHLSSDLDTRKRLLSCVSKTRAELSRGKQIGLSGVSVLPADKVQMKFDELMEKDEILVRIETFIKNIQHHKYTIRNSLFNTLERKKALSLYIKEVEILMALLKTNKVLTAIHSGKSQRIGSKK